MSYQDAEKVRQRRSHIAQRLKGLVPTLAGAYSAI